MNKRLVKSSLDELMQLEIENLVSFNTCGSGGLASSWFYLGWQAYKCQFSLNG